MGTTANSGDPRFAGIPPLSGWISFGGILDFDAGVLSRFWASGWRLSPSQYPVGSTHTWWDPADPEGWLIQGDLDNTVEYGTTARLMERAGSSGRVKRDTVDRFSDGTFMSPLARGHRLGIGMNSDALVDWLARLPTLERHGNPIGNVDSTTSPTAGQVRVAGWALDPDTTSPVEIHLYVDGRYRTALQASAVRSDVGRAYPLHGANRGYNVTLDNLAAGSRQVCAYAINTGIGTSNPLLGCRSVTVATGVTPPASTEMTGT